MSMPCAIDQLEKCRSPDGCAPASCCVGGLVYVSMTDEVVDRVMHRRDSVALGWLEQPLTDGRCEKILNAGVLLRVRSVMGRRPMRRAISSFLMKSNDDDDNDHHHQHYYYY